MSAIARVQTDDRNVNQLQSNIITAVNPVLSNPVVDGIILSNISLVSGSNTVDHKLGRKLIGWFFVRQRALASVYDTQDSNKTPEKNLILVASSNINVDIYVF